MPLITSLLIPGYLLSEVWQRLPSQTVLLNAAPSHMHRFLAMPLWRSMPCQSFVYFHLFFCVAFKLCTLSKALRTGDAIFFFPVYVVLTHGGLLVKLFCSLQDAAPLCNFVFYHCPWEITLAVTPHMKEVGERKPPSFSFQGFPDHVYVFSFLLRSFVEVLPSSLFHFYPFCLLVSLFH